MWTLCVKLMFIYLLSAPLIRHLSLKVWFRIYFSKSSHYKTGSYFAHWWLKMDLALHLFWMIGFCVLLYKGKVILRAEGWSFFFLVSADLENNDFFLKVNYYFLYHTKEKRSPLGTAGLNHLPWKVSFVLFHPKMEELNPHPHGFIIKFSWDNDVKTEN